MLIDIQEDIQEDLQEENEKPPPRVSRRSKWFKIGGAIQIIAGATTLAIGLISGGILLIPVIIGGYLVANGLLDMTIKHY